MKLLKLFFKGPFYKEYYHHIFFVHKEQLFKILLAFAFIQAFFTVLLLTLYWNSTLLPRISYLTQETASMFNKASFSHITIRQSSLESDIKPNIYLYTLYNSPKEQVIFAIDTTGNMNPLIWNDRVENGVTKKVRGIGLLNNSLLLKTNNTVRKMEYGPLFQGQHSKEQLISLFNTTFGESALRKYFAVALIPIFILAIASGIFKHLATGLLIGLVLRWIFIDQKLTTYQWTRIGILLYFLYAFLMIIGMSILLVFNVSQYIPYIVLALASLSIAIYVGYIKIQETSLIKMDKKNNIIKVTKSR